VNIKKLLEEYDRKIFAWLEGKSSPRSKRERQASEDTNAWSKVSDRRMVPPSNEVQIPDPWD
jgi:succinate dehydrogenase flavin-adding protein (antitoxin of CptAB toxin-antitoxin module)